MSAVGALFAVLSSGCADGERPIIESTLTIGVPEGNADGTELGVGQLARTITREGLTQLSAEGRAIPRLAARWNWENDGRRLRLLLHDDISLHDGTRLDAQAAAEALAAAIARESNRASYPALGDVRGAVPINDLEFALELVAPSPRLPDDLTVLLDIPAGPYRVVDESERSIRFERFAEYYQGAPSIQRVMVNSFDTLRTAWASLLRGELDMVYDVPVDAAEFIRNDNIDVVSVPRWYQHHLTLNMHDARFRSPLVRKALNMAVDRTAIIRRVLHGAGEPSSGPLYPSYWSFDATIPQYPFDPSGALALLDAAGYHPRTPLSALEPEFRLRFTCLLPKDFIVWQRIALELQRDFLAIGVDMQFRVVPLTEFNELISKGQFEAAFINMISGPTPTRSYFWWRSTDALRGPYNVFGYENDQAEELFDTLRRSPNEVAIRSATSRLQRILYDDPPAVFVAWDTRTRAVSRRFVLPSDERDPMWALWKWTVAEPGQAAARQ